MTKRKPSPATPYPVQTNAETNAVLCAVADGKSGRHWETLLSASARVHQAPGASHFVRLMLTDGERELGIAVEDLTTVTAQCDADDDFILLYVSRLLMPAVPLPANATQWAVVELDDIIKAVGWNPLHTTERHEMRRRIWQFLKFGARAHIVGKRTYAHRDKMTGEIIDTYIDSPAWVFGKQLRAVETQPSLFDDDEPPLTVEMSATPFWARLTAMPDTAQFLPLGEVLGAIPGGKPAGAWARVIGLALANYWRRKPRETVRGAKMPTRAELLQHYTPKTGDVAAILSGNDPRRAVDYWAGALRILVECEFLANEGEATLSLGEHRDRAKGYKWQEGWLKATADVRPGPAMLEAIQGCAKSLPEPKPRQLSKPRRKRKND